MKHLFAILLMVVVGFNAFSQALETDEKALISSSPVFQARIEQVLKDKAQYWYNFATPSRADVNVQTQKRKKFANLIFGSKGFAHNIAEQAGHFWLTTAQKASLDENGIPTADSISNSFDPTYDYYSGVKPGDSDNTEIDW